jgi:hypothetical protein
MSHLPQLFARKSKDNGDGGLAHDHRFQQIPKEEGSYGVQKLDFAKTTVRPVMPRKHSVAPSPMVIRETIWRVWMLGLKVLAEIWAWISDGWTLIPDEWRDYRAFTKDPDGFARGHEGRAHGFLNQGVDALIRNLHRDTFRFDSTGRPTLVHERELKHAHRDARWRRRIEKGMNKYNIQVAGDVTLPSMVPRARATQRRTHVDFTLAPGGKRLSKLYNDSGVAEHMNASIEQLPPTPRVPLQYRQPMTPRTFKRRSMAPLPPDPPRSTAPQSRQSMNSSNSIGHSTRRRQSVDRHLIDNIASGDDKSEDEDDSEDAYEASDRLQALDDERTGLRASVGLTQSLEGGILGRQRRSNVYVTSPEISPLAPEIEAPRRVHTRCDKNMQSDSRPRTATQELSSGQAKEPSDYQTSSRQRSRSPTHDASYIPSSGSPQFGPDAMPTELPTPPHMLTLNRPTRENSALIPSGELEALLGSHSFEPSEPAVPTAPASIGEVETSRSVSMAYETRGPNGFRHVSRIPPVSMTGAATQRVESPRPEGRNRSLVSYLQVEWPSTMVFADEIMLRKDEWGVYHVVG